VVIAVVGAFLLAGGDDNESSEGLAALPGEDPGVAHVHGLGVDPADGTFYAATHHGLFRIPEKGTATRVANRYQDTMGFTVAGPRHFLGSGHPDQREDKPSKLGLIESTDAGQTWRSLSLSGQADFHALEYRHDTVYGYDSGTGQLMVSTDRRNWDHRAKLAMGDLAVSPDDADTILATTEQGLARSTDGGRSFTRVANAPGLLVLAWPTADALFGISSDGVVHHSPDGGRTWQTGGTVEGQPEAVTAPDGNRLYVATRTGIYASTDGGKTFTLRYRDKH